MKRKTGRFPAPGVGLEALVDLYLTEKMEARGMTVKQAARFRAGLVGAFAPEVFGFTRFLQATGVAEPSARDLMSDTIAAFYEYTLQHYGLLRCREAMGALRNFWIWCKKNGLTREQKMPPDLQGDHQVRHPWHVRVLIAP